MVNFKVGDVIIFTDAIVKDECDGSPGVKARIIDLHIDEDDRSMTRVTFNVSEFVEFNKNKWEANYYDINHKPTLTYPESKYYDPKFSYYFMNDDIESEKYFKLDETEIKVDLDFIVARLKELRSQYLSDDNAIRRNVIEGLMNDFGIKA